MHVKKTFFDNLFATLFTLCSQGYHSVKQIVHITRKQGVHAAVDHLGAILKILLEACGAVDGVDHKRRCEDHLALLNERAGEIVAPVLTAMELALRFGAAAFEIQLAQCRRKAFFKDRGKDIAMQ